MDVRCCECEGRMQNKGKKKRVVLHREGEVELKREYYYCPSCKRGFSPLDRSLGLSKPSWSPALLEMALRQAVELGSYARAASNFSELTGVPISASSLERMVLKYGTAVVKAEAEEAEAMVRVPKEEEALAWRQIPEADSEVMAVSADGVMVHLLDEGWKEVKVMSVSAVPVCEEGDKAKGELRLEKHSYRAGLWDAKTFTNHYWAESYRRGVEKAKQIVCINDGAIWIWMMVFISFARRTEILDWWHMLQYVWQIVAQALGPASTEACAWVASQKDALTRSQLRLFFRRIRRLYPRGTALPPAVTQAIAYLWKNRRRMDYAAYRQAGFPISSGAVESAAKTSVQHRMKQAGMRWSRPGAQAMLALRARLLSHRWHQIPI